MSETTAERAIEIVEWGKSLTQAPLTASQVRSLLSIARDRADERSEIAIWVLGFGELPTAQRRAVLRELIEILHDGARDAAVRGQAAEAIGEQYEFVRRCPLRDDAIAALIAALGDPSVDVRFWATFSLGKLRAIEACQQLGELLDDRAAPTGLWPVAIEAGEVLATFVE